MDRKGEAEGRRAWGQRWAIREETLVGRPVGNGKLYGSTCCRSLLFYQVKSHYQVKEETSLLGVLLLLWFFFFFLEAHWEVWGVMESLGGGERSYLPRVYEIYALMLNFRKLPTGPIWAPILESSQCVVPSAVEGPGGSKNNSHSMLLQSLQNPFLPPGGKHT